MADNKTADIKMSTASKTRKSLSKLQKMKDDRTSCHFGRDGLADRLPRLPCCQFRLWCGVQRRLRRHHDEEAEAKEGCRSHPDHQQAGHQGGWHGDEETRQSRMISA